MKEILLASGSPRRREILEQLSIPFQVKPSDVDESEIHHKKAYKLAELLALKKASAVSPHANNQQIVLSADTIVVYKNQVLGKPDNEQDVYNYLSRLSGRCHQVITAIALIDIEQQATEVTHCLTKVCFKPIDHKEITKYIETGEPFDKAGAYGIQGYGSAFVKWIKGDYFNVMGLPISTLIKSFDKLGYSYFTELKQSI